MRIVHVIDSGGFYGAESMLLQLAKSQRHSGQSVSVLSIGKPGEPVKPLEVILASEGIDAIKWRMPILPTPKQIKRMLRFFKDYQSEVVHSHGYKGNIILGLVPKRLRTFPLVSTVHGYTKHPFLSKMTLYQYLDSLMLERVDSIALVSEAMRETVPHMAKKDHATVVWNGIEKCKESRFDYRYNFMKSGPDKSLTIGCLGRLSEEKNFSLIIDCMPKILNEFPNGKLIIHGEGPKRSELESRVRKMNLQQSVQILPYTDDVHRFMNEIDIYVNCSITEGMPISIIEAMRAGKLIVATDIPANRNLLKSVDYHGTLCGLSTNDLTESIYKMVSLKEWEVKRQSDAYRQEFLTKYTADVMAKNYDSLYQEAKERFENCK